MTTIPPEQPKYSKRYTWYVLIVLTGVYTFNFIDRQILTILQESIKLDLDLSDKQLGLLTGLAFAIFYVTLGLPIARFADKNNRKNVVAASLAIWSLLTAVSGLAQNFVQLALARVGVGIGEAGGSPPSHAIVSDYFPEEKRATALSIYSMGIYIGIFLGFLVGGIIAQNYGWRAALYTLGIPGVLYAILVYITIKEPPKGLSDKVKIKDLNAPSLKEVARLLLSKKTFIFIAIATGLHTFGTYGVGNFFPPFMQRVHHLDVQTVGIWLGITTGLGGGIGTYLGGYLADRFREKDIRWYIWITLIAGLLNTIPFFIIVFHPNSQLVLFTTFFTNFFTAMYLGPTIAVTHSLVDARMRAFASAVLFFILNIIGLGLGPLTVGTLSDWLLPIYGNESLRYAFLFTFITSTISLVLFYLASRNYKKDLKIAENV